jgi:hypothetical protein
MKPDERILVERELEQSRRTLLALAQDQVAVNREIRSLNDMLLKLQAKHAQNDARGRIVAGIVESLERSLI